MLNTVCRSLLTVNVILFQPTRSLFTAAARLTSHQPFRDVYRPADCVSVAGVLAKTHLNNPFLITRSLRYSAARTAVGNKADETKTEPGAVTDVNNEPPVKPSLFQRFKQMYKDYWYVLIPVHVVTSIGWTGAFYYSVKKYIHLIIIFNY